MIALGRILIAALTAILGLLATLALASMRSHRLRRVRRSPRDLRELWSTSRESWLFEDMEYGHWGLHLLRPAESAARTSAERAQRSDDFRPDDVVLGEFLGDAELLVYAPSEVGGRRYRRGRGADQLALGWVTPIWRTWW